MEREDFVVNISGCYFCFDVSDFRFYTRNIVLSLLHFLGRTAHHFVALALLGIRQARFLLCLRTCTMLLCRYILCGFLFYSGSLRSVAFELLE